tara:strand:- start:51170 stop:52273 length:1104 start_codon:yes stop_codon:yes gene_type:complete
MAIYYVAKSGNDSNAGTDIAAPKLTIDNAVGVARSSADNIVEIIDSGQYDEGDIEILSNAVTVRATGTNKPILDGDSGNEDHAFQTYVSGCVFQGLTFRNYDDQLIDGFTTAGLNFILSGCVGYLFGGPQHIGGGGGTEIHRCKIVATSHRTLNVHSGNVWINNSFLATNAVGYPVIVSSITYPKVTASFCTIVGSAYENSSNRNYNLINQVHTVRNCIISGTGDGINAYDSTYNLVKVSGDPFIEFSSDSWDGTPRTAGTGEVTGDPIFISGSKPGWADPALAGNATVDTQNYTPLNSSSPAAGAGVAAYGITLDLTGTTRGAPPDIGALELIATGYGNIVIGVDEDDIEKVLTVASADISKVIGV